MKKFLLMVGKVIAGLVGLIVLWLASDWGWEQYKFYSWNPPTAIDGISPGMTRSDVLFQKGSPHECFQIDPIEESCVWREELESSFLAVLFASGVVKGIQRTGNGHELGTPFRSVEDMRRILGNEDILATADDGVRRLYTYGEHDISFGFQQNSLQSIRLGTVTWRSLDKKNGEYFVGGRKICPGDNCPFNPQTGELKPEYEGKSYRDFLPRR